MAIIISNIYIFFFENNKIIYTNLLNSSRKTMFEKQYLLLHKL